MPERYRLSSAAPALALLGLPLTVGPDQAATFTVNSTVDAVDAIPGNGVCDAFVAKVKAVNDPTPANNFEYLGHIGGSSPDFGNRNCGSKGPRAERPCPA